MTKFTGTFWLAAAAAAALSLHCCLSLCSSSSRTDAALCQAGGRIRHPARCLLVAPHQQAGGAGRRRSHSSARVEPLGLGARATTTTTTENSRDAAGESNKDTSSDEDDGNTSGTTSTSAAPAYRPGSLMAATAEQGRVPYGEESRKYRRTVFTAQDWVQHRNEDRILSNIKGIFFSGIVRQLQQEILLVTAISSAVVLLENSGLLEVTLPSLPFQLSSPALGLLLVFRTNTSYARWSEARATWARIVSHSRNVVRMACAFSAADWNSAAAAATTNAEDDDSREASVQSLRRLADAVWLFNRSMMNRLLSEQEDEENYRLAVRATLQRDGELAERILQSSVSSSSEQRTVAALAELSLALDAVPIDEKRRVEIDKSVVILGECYSTCEKIFQTPVPLVYTRHTARFLALWMILLPAALYEPFATEDFSGALFFKGFAVIPTTGLVALFLFGIEELAKQLEEPFSILPLETFCDTIRTSNRDMLEWCIESSSRRMQHNNDSKQPTSSSE